MTRSPITTHVLDTTLGKPAAGVPITLEYQEPPGFAELGRGVTDADGRIANLLHPEHQLSPGRYRMTFDTQAYFRSIGTESFYPVVQVVFDLAAPGQHYHIPLLLSPFGYSTYRGS
jgi:5-hydroxyisourate hydrolase